MIKLFLVCLLTSILLTAGPNSPDITENLIIIEHHGTIDTISLPATPNGIDSFIIALKPYTLYKFTAYGITDQDTIPFEGKPLWACVPAEDFPPGSRHGMMVSYDSLRVVMYVDSLYMIHWFNESAHIKGSVDHWPVIRGID